MMKSRGERALAMMHLSGQSDDKEILLIMVKKGREKFKSPLCSMKLSRACETI